MGTNDQDWFSEYCFHFLWEISLKVPANEQSRQNNYLQNRHVLLPAVCIRSTEYLISHSVRTSSHLAEGADIVYKQKENAKN